MAITGIPLASASSARRGWCSIHAGSTKADAEARSLTLLREQFSPTKGSKGPSSAAPRKRSSASIPDFSAAANSNAPLRPSLEAGKNNEGFPAIALRGIGAGISMGSTRRGSRNQPPAPDAA